MLAINTSPEKESGAVSLLLEPFLDGLREYGAEAELCYACDLATDKLRDSGDMQQLQQKIGRADVLVLASPLYFDGRTGPEGATPALRMLLERFVPGTRMPEEKPYRGATPRKVVIASGSGFWEIDRPCPALTDVVVLCQGAFPAFTGNVAWGVLLRCALPRGLMDWDLIPAAREAGYQLACEDAASPTAHDIARREAVTRHFYDQIVNGDTYRKTVSYVVPARVKCMQRED